MNMKDVKEIQIPDSRYRQLEYIKFSGAEYINTGLTVSGNTSYKKLDIKASFQNTTNWGINGFDSNANRFNIGVNGNGYTRIGVGNTNTWADNDGVLLSLNTVYILSLLVNGTANSSVYDEQGSLIGTGATVSPSFSSDTGDLYIGAANSNNSAVAFCEEKIYNIKLSITNSNNIISNLIPAQRKSDNVCGLYDIIRNSFYPMQGTEITDNAAGPTVVENMPMYVKKIESNNQIIWGSQSAFPYRRLEYIDIPADAYINLNTTNNNNTTGISLDVNLNIDNDSLGNALNPFGSIYRPNASTSTYHRYHIQMNDNSVSAWYGSGASTNLGNIGNQRSFIELNNHTWKDGKAYVDNVDKGTFTPSTTNCGKLFLGARRFDTAGTITINNYAHKIRCWYIKIQENGNIATDYSLFYPVQRKSDGKVGLLKIWNNGGAVRFCTSETSTNCIAGPTVQEYFEGTHWVN